MSDPFEDSKNPALPNLPPSQQRERSVQQAVDFLNDPRVRNAHPGKALDFLRQKGITEDELREAYRRCNLPFPGPAGAPFVPSHHLATQPYVPYQRPARTSWVSLFLGITAAAGIYTAVREVLRRYIVPMYFPDAARIADERRRREENTFHAQERQIAELRERIQDLVDSSNRTSDRMARLSKSLSSSVALRERELSETSQLREAIQQLSHTVSMSTGTSASRGMQATSSHPKNSSQYRDHRQLDKRGSSMYSGVIETSSVRRSVDMRTDEVNGNESGATPTAAAANGATVSKVNGYVSSNVRGNEEIAGQEEDDFMSIPPAEVEESWKKHITNTGTSGTSARSSSRGDEKDAAALDKPAETVENTEVEETAQNKAIVEDGVATNMTTDVIATGTDTDVVATSTETDVVATSMTTDVMAGREIGFNYVEPARETASGAVARQLFRFEMMREASNALSKDAEKTEFPGRLRPNSMPPMDTPLSDIEE